MKKLFMVSLLTLVAIQSLTFTSCNLIKSEPTFDYEVEGFISKKDWKNSKDLKDPSKISFYILNKKLWMKDIYENATDSMDLSLFMSADDFRILPSNNTTHLKNILTESLDKSKNACKNPITFKPKSLTINVWDEKDTKEKLVVIQTKFLASNLYGVPSELTGYFKFDPKNNYKIIEEMVF